MGPYTRFAVRSTGEVIVPHGSADGGLNVYSTHYPVIQGIRTKESSVAADEEVFSRVTKSSLTATRVSTKYSQKQFKAGFGTDISFQTEGTDGLVEELGTIGFAHDGRGGPNADFIIKSCEFLFAAHCPRFASSRASSPPHPH
jgi:hypothetical protein